jgi:hypothetical protein
VKRVIKVLAVLAVCAAVGYAAGGDGTVPDRVTLDVLANLYPPVELDHALHAEITGDCVSCHHQPFGEPAQCSDCHDDAVKPSAFVHELHWEIEDCTGCHHRPQTDDLRCVSCHSVEPDLERPAMIGLKGAYHGLCLRCHEVSGPDASCTVCHPDGR